MSDVDGLLCIGLLEDDADFREELALGLGGYGFRVCVSCDNPAEFYRQLEDRPCDLVILDANMPGADGFSVATRLRAQSSMGIIILTGRGALEDRVRGLEGGADAYLTKPVDLLELSSVIRSLVRRMRLSRAGTLVPETHDARTSWSLLEGGWILVSPGGTELHLSAQERTLVMALFEASGTAVSRQELAALLNPGNSGEFELRRIDVLVSRLRAKAQSSGLKLPVLSVRGQGYVFAA
jgi:two-component system, OmpR family, response regulator PhoP